MGIARKAGDPLAAEPGRVEDALATELLREDHRKIRGIFEEFERTEDAAAKRRLVETALVELTIHAALEEELFYPETRREIEDAELMDEAVEEHALAKVLLAQLAEMTPSQPRYDAKFLVLAESVRRHIEQEEGAILPEAERAGFDLEALGQRMSERRLELAEQVTIETIRDLGPAGLDEAEPAPRPARGRAPGRGRRSARGRPSGTRGKTRARQAQRL
jgi:hypothetical protein